MKSISQIALYTNDIKRLTDFYRNYFLALKDGEYTDPKKGMKTCLLRFDSETRMEIIAMSGLAEREEGRSVGFAHLAFSMGSETEVDSMTAELVKGGAPLIQPPQKDSNGVYMSCVYDPDGNEIQIIK